MKRILIFGVAGFVGAHLTKALAKDGRYSITGVDLQNEKIKDILCDITYIKLDLSNKRNDKRLDDLVKKNDVIISLAAICNPALYVKEPLATFKIGFLDNLKIVEMCAKYSKRLIQFSTCEVYGKSPAVFKAGKYYFQEDESFTIRGPINKQRWIYSAGKELLERVIYAHGARGDLNYTIVRPFNYIGPKIDYLPSESAGSPRVISCFIDALMYGKPMYLVDGGLQRRCYTYIEDATDAHVRIVHNRGGKCDNQIFNVGTNDNETSIKDLAILMRKIYRKSFMEKGEKLPNLLKMKGEAFYGKGYDDIDRRLVDNSKLAKRTGWQPRWLLEPMLFETMKYYVDRKKRM